MCFLSPLINQHVTLKGTLFSSVLSVTTSSYRCHQIKSEELKSLKIICLKKVLVSKNHTKICPWAKFQTQKI